VNEAFIAIIPNLYPCFAVVDRAYDFTKQLKALLNPATTALHQAAPGLDLFDTQGNLQRESALVSQVLEVLRDLEDEGRSTEGAELLDSAASKGFRGFLRPPFGWPDELVRLVLAACFRAGAVCVEHQTGTGIGRIYDYRGTDTYFAKITLFKKLAFRVAETSLTVEQIKQAGKTLIALGVTGIPESGNAIASAIRSLGRGLKASLDDARTRAQQGLPVPDSVLSADTALAAASTSQDPTECVVTFLAVADQWRALAAALIDLRAFLDADRHKDFRLSVCLAEVVNNHPAPQHDPGAKVLSQALLDMTALTQDKAVISRWRDYRDAFDQMFHAYRDAYLQTYTRMREATEETIASIKNSGVYRNAPADAREQVLAKTFAAGGACCYPAITLPTVQALLDATSRRSLSALEQAGVALPGYRVKVEQELAALYAPSVDERVYEWRPAQALLGKRFQTEDEVDHALHEIGAELKAQIRRGYRVIVK
jgi:hypothetical protein